MNTTLLKEIIAFIFGRKYYANIITTRGINRDEISSFIFATRQDAHNHRDQLLDNTTYRYIETISFRSRNTYTCVKR